MNITVRNNGRVPIARAGRVFPPRRTTTLSVDPKRVDDIATSPALEIIGSVEDHACADCDRSFGSEQGLATHRRAKHAES